MAGAATRFAIKAAVVDEEDDLAGAGFVRGSVTNRAGD